MFKYFSNDNSVSKKWDVVKSEINKHLNKNFKTNPLLNAENYYYWTKNNLYIKIEMIESFNFYSKDNQIHVEKKPVFSNYQCLLVIDYNKNKLYFKTKKFKVSLNPLEIKFVQRDASIDSDDYSTFKHALHLTNIFYTESALFKFLSIEPINVSIILHLIIKILKTKSLYLFHLTKWLK